MQKNKTRKCKQCGELFETVQWKINQGRAKFCSRPCANWFLADKKRLKNKICPSCKLEYKPNRTIQKYCSPKCQNEGRRIKPRTCAFCKKKYQIRFNPKYCSKKCVTDHQKIRRIGKNNPAYREGLWANGKRDREGERGFSKIRDEIISEMVKCTGAPHCQRCVLPGLRLEAHHIIYRSEARGHRNLHKRQNCILVCTRCHNWFHKHKPNRANFVIGRKLWNLFPEFPYLKNNQSTIPE